MKDDLGEANLNILSRPQQVDMLLQKAEFVHVPFGLPMTISVQNQTILCPEFVVTGLSPDSVINQMEAVARNSQAQHLREQPGVTDKDLHLIVLFRGIMSPERQFIFNRKEPVESEPDIFHGTFAIVSLAKA